MADRIDLNISGQRPPEPILRLIEEAESKFAAWQEKNDRVPSLVSSNFWLAYEVLQHCQRQAKGLRFCEWGSGSGVVTCLAAAVGYRATGIENNQGLLDFSRSLADDQQLSASFCLGSYKPDDGSSDEEQVRALSKPLGFTPFDFDLIYVYPWPAEKQLVVDLFGLYASGGTLLIVNQGGADMQLYRQAESSG